jgi:hypothetical protein
LLAAAEQAGSAVESQPEDVQPIALDHFRSLRASSPV